MTRAFATSNKLPLLVLMQSHSYKRRKYALPFFFFLLSCNPLTNTENITGPIAPINPERNKVVPTAGLYPVYPIQNNGMIIQLLIVRDNYAEAFPYPEKMRRAQVWEGTNAETKLAKEKVLILPYNIITIY